VGVLRVCSKKNSIQNILKLCSLSEADQSPCHVCVCVLFDGFYYFKYFHDIQILCENCNCDVTKFHLFQIQS
jgi:hypothetical protein